MVGFFGCTTRNARVVDALLARMSACPVVGDANVTRVATAAYVGKRDAGGAAAFDAWVVIAGFVREDDRVLSSDEVLRRLRARGIDAVASFGGEFALAARFGRDTFIARDRHGTRPLYYAEARCGHLFATAMGPLLAARVPAAIDRGAVITSLVLGYVPAPATVLVNVKQVPPGHIVKLAASASPRAYWVPRERIVPRGLPASARSLDRALTRAVARAPAEGRVGAFLSGGLDSSLVLARLRELGREVEAYTLHFGDRLPSEIRYATSVARHVGVRHHVLDLDARAFCDAIEPSLVHLEDLLSEPIAVPNFLLAREAARTRDVVFTGEGGDPLFGGPKNIGMVLERLYGARRLGASYLSAHHHLFDDLDSALETPWRRAFDDEALLGAIERCIVARKPSETFVGQLMVTNLAMKGGSNILVKVSKMVGAHGLALRSPLFDPLVVDAGLAIPPWHKLRGTDEKIVLKHAVRRSLPAEVVERSKRGMAVPLRAWFAGTLGELAHDVLTPRRVRERGIFRPEYVARLLAHEKLPSDLARSRGAEKLWLVLVCELHQRTIGRLAAAA
jgi:asparagine synthase (glutamine-hydrolysing)